MASVAGVPYRMEHPMSGLLSIYAASNEVGQPGIDYPNITCN